MSRLAIHACFLSCVAGITALQGQTFETLASFNGTNGNFTGLSALNAKLVQGLDGNFYGTTPGGGDGTTCLPGGSGCGTVFRVTPAGALTVIYSFCTAGYPTCADGFSPGSLILGENGAFYGVSEGGVGSGNVFKITPAGVLTSYPLCTTDCFYSATGTGPVTLMQASSGVFYGTTSGGGPNAVGGAIFKMTPAGAFSPFYSFCETTCADGTDPQAPLSQGSDGNFYGTTAGGNSLNVYGTAFQITPSGVLTTLHTFCSEANCTDGANPYAGLVQGSNGAFYGATYRDGVYGGGVLFDITSTGSLTPLHDFGAQVSGGFEPYATLTLATDGNFYGTTITEGAHQEGGTIFRIGATGKFTTLYSFCAQTDCADGAEPYSGVFQATDGSFYGITPLGGANDLGAVFKLSVGLGPFVTLLPAMGKAGASIRILGTNLTGTTAVSFNGAAASFTVQLPTLIVATVPAATSGKVEVITPSGTLSSNRVFRVQ